MKLRNKGFSTIEILVIIALVSILTLDGLGIVYLAVENQKENTFKEDANVYLTIGQNAYLTLNSKNISSYQSTSDGTKKMCITLKGLKENSYLKSIKDNYEGYIVIEENDIKTNYYITLTDKKLFIDNISSNDLTEISIKDGSIKKEKNKNINVDGLTCIDEKIE